MHLLRQLRVRPFVLMAAATLAAAACDSSTAPSTPSQITVAGGNSVNGRVAQQAPVTVTVTASNGKALANQQVTFAIASGGGTVTPGSATTDANGQASAVWTFGNALGAQTLTVTSGSVQQTVTATVAAGLPATVTLVAGAGQSGPVGSKVQTPPAIKVTDAGGNPVQGVPVTFTTAPGGSVAPTGQVTTDANGVAQLTSWTLGNQAGTYTLTATVLDPNIKTGNPLTITATATAATASKIQTTGSVPATATVGSALPSTGLPSVVVVDAFGNPVSGVPVTFTSTAGGGTITGGTVNTNAQGIATVGGFTLGQSAGVNTITATAQGAGSVTFSVTGTPDVPATTRIVSGNNQSAQAGSPLNVGPSVQVVDRFGNPVPGATVQFVVTGGNGSVLQGTQTTNSQGIATVGGWTLGVTPGANTLVARVNGAADVTFTATGLAGAPAQLLKVSSDTTRVVAFKTSAPLTVRVLDAAGFPVANTPVTFALATTSAGSLSATTVQTDAQGNASVTLTANSTLGANTVTATVGNLTPVTFTVITSQNAAAQVTALTPLNQTATAGGMVPFPPKVKITDAAGNPVAGIKVFFGAYTAAGQVPDAVQNVNAVTDSAGIASAGSWTLTTVPGDHLLAAISSVPSNVPGSTLTFTATAITIPQGTTISQVAGSPPAIAAAGSSVPVAVQVKDPNGNPVPGATVTFQVTLGGGNIGGQVLFTTNTDASGIARVPAWTLGTTAGVVNSLSAQVVSGPQLVINVTTQ